MHILGHLTVEEFLRDYWQKKPVLIRNAWPGFKPLLSAEELAGLSLEEEIESRIVQEEGPDEPWQVSTGPFSEDTYQNLPKEKWTLLVQAVDQWIPEAADLLEHFRFIPSWRIDDLMISYAVNGGSVGPHYDQYDVFLLQAEGQREWRIGQMCSEQSAIVKGPKIRLLEQFDQTDSFVLNSGDMLYLPPKLAHYGIAQGECMTYSIGFRAPSVAELSQALADDISQHSSEDIRYHDADLKLQADTGLVSSEASQRLRELIADILNDEDRLQNILGRLMTEPKYPDYLPDVLDDIEWEDLAEELAHSKTWRRAEFARFAFSDGKETLSFYALGMSREFMPEQRDLLAYLSNTNEYNTETLLGLAKSEEAQALLLQLCQRQYIYSIEE